MDSVSSAIAITKVNRAVPLKRPFKEENFYLNAGKVIESYVRKLGLRVIRPVTCVRRNNGIRPYKNAKDKKSSGLQDGTLYGKFQL